MNLTIENLNLHNDPRPPFMAPPRPSDQSKLASSSDLEEDIKRLNFSTLKHAFPKLDSILTARPHAHLYSSPSAADTEANWKACPVSGPLFIIKIDPDIPMTKDQTTFHLHVPIPRYAVVIKNRQNLTDFAVEITNIEGIDIQSDFIFIANQEWAPETIRPRHDRVFIDTEVEPDANIYGLWLHMTAEEKKKPEEEQAEIRLNFYKDILSCAKEIDWARRRALQQREAFLNGEFAVRPDRGPGLQHVSVGGWDNERDDDDDWETSDPEVRAIMMEMYKRAVETYPDKRRYRGPNTEAEEEVKEEEGQEQEMEKGKN